MFFKDSKINPRIAKAQWRGVEKEKNVLKKRSALNQINRVDQMWPLLKEAHGSILALDAPHAVCPEKVTYEELANKISLAASSFSKLGIRSGDVVALFSENSPRWLIVDQGLMRLGAANAVRGVSAPVDELRYILEDSKAVGLIVQNDQLWKELDLTEAQINKLKFVLQLEGVPIDDLLSWKEFLLKSQSNDYIDVYNEVSSNSIESPLATILYTSGTTGRPKGVPLSHSNLLHQIRSLACIANPSPGTPLLSVLPIWHSYERSAEYYFFSCGCTQNYTTIKNLKSDLQRVRPVVMATVPRLWEAIKTGFDDAIKKLPKSRRKILQAALMNSKNYKLALRKARNLMLFDINFLDRFFALLEASARLPLHLFSSYLFWAKLRKQLSGGNLLFPINGGGAIAPHVDEFFEAIGIELLVGYGLTETSPVVSCRRPWRNIRGSSGGPLPETEFQIINPETKELMNLMECGIVLVRGPQVMKGYLGKPDESAKVLDVDGWFNTGDLGMLLKDGSLVLTGRAKDTIVLSNGENIEPGPLEEALLASPIIDQVMIVGQDQKQLGALLVPNLEQLVIWAKSHGIVLQENIELLSQEKALEKLMRKEINTLLDARNGSRPDERVAGIAFVKPFSLENGLLTQTLKQKRALIVERDQKAIGKIFGNKV